MTDLDKRVAELLDAEWDETSTSMHVAQAIVAAVRAHDLASLKEAAPPIRPGLAFKTPFSSSVHHVRWFEDGLFWIVTASSRYGWLGEVNASMWETISEAKIQAKTAEKMSVNDEGLKAGMRLKWKQGQVSFEVLAVSPKAALMRSTEGKLYVEPNDALMASYRPI